MPDPQDPATFARSKLDWAELAEPQHARLFLLYRELIRLRRELPGLTDPSFDSVSCEFDDSTKWFRMNRPGVSVIINFSALPLEVPAPAGTILLATAGNPEVRSGVVSLDAYSAVVIRT